ncbi:murein biosynthesis integral membrane protein MurJ [Thermicanus aegyptius]|uniref:murein biosynthesis integral membrane protein MurJ n=1 Tax=Thermicanus aegyptius TaxID=94009 RepID=UPI00041BA27E|nr:murein biosynthesis integral membrane protein MurJ [Thermicanus aegyptius]
MNRNKAIKITAWIMVITLTSKILGFLRETAIAAYFGASNESDAFFVAFSIPGILFAVVAGAIGTSFIPVYTRLDEKHKAVYFNNMFNVLGFFTLIITGVSLLFAPQIVKWFAFGFSSDTLALTVVLTRIMLLSLLFMLINALFTSFLQSNQRFLIPAAIGIPYNLVVIFYLLIAGSSYGIEGFAWMVVLSVLIQALFQLFGVVKEKWKYRFVFDLKEPGLRQTLHMTGPVLIGTMVGQVNVLVDRMLASGLSEGSISALNYANKVSQLAFGIIVVSIISVLYPKLAEQASQAGKDDLKRLTRYAMRVLMIVLVPILFGGVILARPIIQILFERGAFDAADTDLTTVAFIFFNLGIVGLGLHELFSRVFFSLQDTRTTMWNGVIALLVNIVLNLILVRPMAHGGLALATSISYTLSGYLLLRSLGKKIGKIMTAEVWMTIGKTTASSLVMSIIVYFLYPLGSIEQLHFLVKAGWLFFVMAVGAAAYAAMLWVLRETIFVDLTKQALGKVKRRFVRGIR